VRPVAVDDELVWIVTVPLADQTDARITGIDLTEQMLRVGRDRVARLDPLPHDPRRRLQDDLDQLRFLFTLDASRRLRQAPYRPGAFEPAGLEPRGPRFLRLAAPFLDPLGATAQKCLLFGQDRFRRAGRIPEGTNP